jgi:hypothetical protein
MNGIIIGFHPVMKKINWQSTNAGFAHLCFFLDFLIRIHKIQVDKFQIELMGFKSCILDMESDETLELAGPVFSKQEVNLLNCIILIISEFPF